MRFLRMLGAFLLVASAASVAANDSVATAAIKILAFMASLRRGLAPA